MLLAKIMTIKTIITLCFFLFFSYQFVIFGKSKTTRVNFSITTKLHESVISNGINTTDWSTVRSYEWLTKSDDREAGVQFVHHEYYLNMIMKKASRKVKTDEMLTARAICNLNSCKMKHGQKRILFHVYYYFLTC